jgi:hypothetical protein
MSPILTRLIASGAAAGAAVGARRAAEAGWWRARGAAPPTSETEVRDHTDLRDRLAWTGLLLVSVLLARRLATSTTERLLGSERR